MNPNMEDIVDDSVALKMAYDPQAEPTLFSRLALIRTMASQAHTSSTRHGLRNGTSPSQKSALQVP